MRNISSSAKVVPATSRVSSSRSVQRVVGSRRPRAAAAAAQSSLLEAVDAKPVAPQPPSGAAVVSPLVGKKVLQLRPGLSAVPLLHPTEDNLPFAASLQIYSHSSAAAPASTSNRQHASNLVELHYVISGKGHFSNAATGVQQALGPGDSIISVLGAASFAAGPMPGGDSQHQQQQQQGVAVQAKPSSGPAWSHMLGWLQQLHSTAMQQVASPGSVQPAAAPAASPGGDSRTGSSTGSSGGSSQLVMLQLLLPSELLTGEMAHHHAGHAHAVAQQLPWSSTSHNQPCSGSNSSDSSSSPSSSGSIWDVEGDEVCLFDSIHEAHVCGLLADAGLVSSTHAEQSVHSPSQPQHTHDDQQQHEHTGGNISAHRDSSSASGSSAPSSLKHQQCQKRALREVGAFQLPQQTNRLALLFGPHASPAVCCSFGVEAFEPGHVTPMHIHNTAHELFFVLAGKGEAVFGEGGDGADAGRGVQRVVVGPGDVAVFPPGVVHGVDNPGESQLYCLQMMLPNEAFVEWVRSGQEAGSLDVSALQRLAAAASCG